MDYKVYTLVPDSRIQPPAQMYSGATPFATPNAWYDKVNHFCTLADRLEVPKTATNLCHLKAVALSSKIIQDKIKKGNKRRKLTPPPVKQKDIISIGSDEYNDGDSLFGYDPDGDFISGDHDLLVTSSS